MLRGIRTASANWLGKIVMGVVLGLIAISFAIWGIGDIFRGFGRSSLARIGGTEISIEQFRQLYSERLQQLGRQLGRPITLDQARQMGIDQQLVGQLIGEATLDERVKALRLGISDAEMARRITTNPELLGPTGQFDRTRFEMMLRNNQITERRFIDEQRRLILRRQLAGTVLTGTQLPKAAMEAAERYQNEQRTVEYVLLERAQAGEIPDPTPEQLAKYFEERKALFRAPEYRKIVMLPLMPGEQAMWTQISDADVQSAYEERRARYLTPERRTLQQIVFTNPEEAQAAAERIAKGEAFLDIAKERKLTEKEIDLGTLTKVRDHRPGGRRCRLRAQGGRGQRAGQRTLRHRAGARASRSSRNRCGRSTRSATSSARSSRTSAPAPRSCRSTTRSRTSARSAGRWRRPRPT